MTEMEKILPAIAAAIGDVRKLGKGDRNKHDGYNFASVDDFLALVNPICSQHGIVVLAQEEGIEDFTRAGRNGESSWMRVSFGFTVYHSSGQCLPTVRRTVEVLRNGAQAYGSAQSYALKQFMRALLLIPTGDKDDADFQRTDDGVVSRQPLPTRVDSAPRENRAASGLRDAWTDGVLDSLPPDANPRQKAEAFARAIRNGFCGKKAKALDNEWERRKKWIDVLEGKYPDLYAQVETAYNSRRDQWEAEKG
jgi:hypothetical protein